MTHYVALIDGKAGGYGVAFPDAPGCTAMGETLSQAYANAVEALREWMTDRIAAGLPAPDARSLDSIAEDPMADFAEATTSARCLCSSIQADPYGPMCRSTQGCSKRSMKPLGRED